MNADGPQVPATPARRVCKVPANYARGIIASLRASGRFEETGAPAADRFYGTFAGKHAVEVRTDGFLAYPDVGSIRALVVQSIKGNLPPPSARFLMGIDEAGLGGEARQAYLSLVMVGSESVAELIAEGLRDSKAVTSTDELERLAEFVRKSTPLERTIPVPLPPSGKSFATVVAQEAGKLLANLAAAGQIPRDTRIRIDATDQKSFFEALGEFEDELKKNIVIETAAEKHVEVAAASILATLASRQSGRPAPRATPKETPIQHFTIGPHRSADKDQVVSYLGDLENSYPDIAKWIGKDGQPNSVWAKIEEGKYYLTVARFGDEITGFCITQEKDRRNAKISTFYVAKPYRGRHIGPGILQRELARLAKKGFRRVMVTFAHEEFFEMQKFLVQYGFQVDGISPQRYRDNSYEVIMGKRFRPGLLLLKDFHDFVQQELFRLQGYDIDAVDSVEFLATPRQDLFAIHQLPPGRQYLVRTSISATPEKDLDELRRHAKARNAYPILVAAAGLPAIEPLPNDVLIYDEYSLESLFYPMSIERPTAEDLVIPIQPEFAQRLLPSKSQTTLAPARLALRMETVYYRTHDTRGLARRGARLFFYESQGKGAFCVAKLKQMASGSPKKLHARYGGLGTWSLKDLEDHAKGGELQAYCFEWLQELQENVTYEELKTIHPGFNPVTVVRLKSAESEEVLKRGKPK